MLGKISGEKITRAHTPDNPIKPGLLRTPVRIKKESGVSIWQSRRGITRESVSRSRTGSFCVFAISNSAMPRVKRSRTPSRRKNQEHGGIGRAENTGKPKPTHNRIRTHAAHDAYAELMPAALKTEKFPLPTPAALTRTGAGRCSGAEKTAAAQYHMRGRSTAWPLRRQPDVTDFAESAPASAVDAHTMHTLTHAAARPQKSAHGMFTYTSDANTRTTNNQGGVQ